MKYIILVLSTFLIVYLVKRTKRIRLFQRKVIEANCPCCKKPLGKQDFSKTFMVKPSYKGSDTSGYLVTCINCKEDFRLTYGGRIFNEKIEPINLIH